MGVQPLSPLPTHLRRVRVQPLRIGASFPFHALKRRAATALEAATEADRAACRHDPAECREAASRLVRMARRLMSECDRMIQAKGDSQ